MYSSFTFCILYCCILPFPRYISGVVLLYFCSFTPRFLCTSLWIGNFIAPFFSLCSVGVTGAFHYCFHRFLCSSVPLTMLESDIASTGFLVFFSFGSRFTASILREDFYSGRKLFNIVAYATNISIQPMSLNDNLESAYMWGFNLEKQLSMY